MPLPQWSAYSGPNALRVEVGCLVIWFSYAEPIAFRHDSTGLVVSENAWSTTTGRHISAVPGAKDAERIRRGAFEQALALLCGRLRVAGADSTSKTDSTAPVVGYGTAWVAPDEGATWNEIETAFLASMLGDDRATTAGLLFKLRQEIPDDRTRLRLTGAALRDYDIARIETMVRDEVRHRHDAGHAPVARPPFRFSHREGVGPTGR